MNNSQQISELIKAQAKKKNIPIKTMLSDLNMGINTISELSKGKQLSYISFSRIADYLDVSVDYLLGRTDEALPGTKKQAAETGSLSNEDITEQVISLFRQMNARERREFLSLALHEFDEQLQEEASHDPGKSDP